MLTKPRMKTHIIFDLLINLFIIGIEIGFTITDKPISHLVIQVHYFKPLKELPSPQ